MNQDEFMNYNCVTIFNLRCAVIMNFLFNPVVFIHDFRGAQNGSSTSSRMSGNS